MCMQVFLSLLNYLKLVKLCGVALFFPLFSLTLSSTVLLFYIALLIQEIYLLCKNDDSVYL